MWYILLFLNKKGSYMENTGVLQEENIKKGRDQIKKTKDRMWKKIIKTSTNEKNGNILSKCFKGIYL